MPKTKWGRYHKNSVSLSRAQMEMIDRIAIEEGHGNFSRVIQEAVERELRARFGHDYAKRLLESEQQHDTAAD